MCSSQAGVQTLLPVTDSHKVMTLSVAALMVEAGAKSTVL